MFRLNGNAWYGNSIAADAFFEAFAVGVSDQGIELMSSKIAPPSVN